MSSQESTYYFWVEDPPEKSWLSLVQLRPPLALCTIDSRAIVIAGQPHVEIPLSQVDHCRPFLTISVKPPPYVTLEWMGGYRRGLIPVNVLRPWDDFAIRDEVCDLCEVIQALREGRTPQVEPNPYHRELKRRKRETEIQRRDWQSQVSPVVYYREDHPPPTSGKVLKGLLIFLVGVVICVIILASLFGGFHVEF